LDLAASASSRASLIQFCRQAISSGQAIFGPRRASMVATNSAARSKLSGVPVSSHAKPPEQFQLEAPLAQIVIVEIADLELAARRWRQCGSHIGDLFAEEVESSNGIIGRGD
jgi:hypothetical protein